MVRGVFLLTPLALALLAIVAWPIATTVALASFEQRRWAESDHAGGSSRRSGSEDDE